MTSMLRKTKASMIDDHRLAFLFSAMIYREGLGGRNVYCCYLTFLFTIFSQMDMGVGKDVPGAQVPGRGDRKSVV